MGQVKRFALHVHVQKDSARQRKKKNFSGLKITFEAPTFWHQATWFVWVWSLYLSSYLFYKGRRRIKMLVALYLPSSILNLSKSINLLFQSCVKPNLIDLNIIDCIYLQLKFSNQCFRNTKDRSWIYIWNSYVRSYMKSLYGGSIKTTIALIWNFQKSKLVRDNKNRILWFVRTLVEAQKLVLSDYCRKYYNFRKILAEVVIERHRKGIYFFCDDYLSSDSSAFFSLKIQIL